MHLATPKAVYERYGMAEAKSDPTPADSNVKLVKNDGVSKAIRMLTGQVIMIIDTQQQEMCFYLLGV